MRALAPRARAASNAGIAILAVLLVLLALLVLCAPFLMTARNASRASAQLADSAQGRLALDSAARYARSELGRSHPSVDPTPWFDDAAELEIRMDLDASALDPYDANGVMWEAVASDVAGTIDLNSAPPQVFANLLGASTRLNTAAKKDDDSLVVATTAGFAPKGFLWVSGELIGYSEKDATSFKRLVRGLAAAEDADGNPLPCGPRPPLGHPPGTPVVDQRAWAPVVWRIQSADGELRAFDAPERVRDAKDLALAGLDAEAVRRIEEGGSVYAGVRAGHVWQRPSRVLNSVRGGQDCSLRLDQTRWYNPGTTVQITDGQTVELGVVEEVLDGGIKLSQALVNDYATLGAVVRPLARRPVNLNTASPRTLEVLFANLQLARTNSRITQGEARALAELVLDSRPFLGFEDFLRRIVLPAAGLETLPEDAPVVPDVLAADANATSSGGLISAYDAVALYANGLNANDSRLAVSTLPFSFTSRDVYALDLRASVNARSGVERNSARREQVEMIVPQDDLLHVFTRQEDFDEVLRLDREAPYWMSGPNATSRYDGGAYPPSRLWAHMGTHAGQPYVAGLTPLPATANPNERPQPEHVFASREEDGWAQLEPARVAEIDRRAGRMLHFDHETRTPEGRFLPDQPVLRGTDDPLVGWTPAIGDLMRAMSFEMWFEPRQLADGVLLDVGATSLETDRVTLALEGPDLVLRVFDGGGDHPETPLVEAGVARYSILPGIAGGSGLAAGTWSHVHVDVRGTRPDQLTMLVDGSAQGVRVDGLTRLAGQLAEGQTLIQLEDGEGFPDRGVVRIGNELIEYVKTAQNVLDASRRTAGINAGFGGRIARVPFELQTSGGELPGNPTVLTSTAFQSQHAAGTPVQLYGYSLALASNVSSASGQLGSGLGPWAVGVIDGVVGGAGTLGDPISVSLTAQNGTPSVEPLGSGMAGMNSQVSGLVLRAADASVTQAQVLQAFNENGGYAAIVQRRIGNLNQGTATGDAQTSGAGDPVGGIEIVRYSGRDATTLFIVQRAALPALSNQQQVPHAFVSTWAGWNDAGGTPLNDQLAFEAFVVPISLPVSGALSGVGFPQPVNGSEFAQITHIDDAELTEWVRYDRVELDQLVRNDPDALEDLYRALLNRQPADTDPATGGGTGPGVPPSPGSSPLTVAPPASPSAQGNGGAYWNPFFGDPTSPPDANWPVTYAARNAFQFRGVAGTFSQSHQQATVVLPTFRVGLGSPDSGWPGAHDTAFLHDGNAASLGFPVHVHRAYWPVQHTLRPWIPAGDPLLAQAGTTTFEPEDAWLVGFQWVALQQPAPIPVPAGTTNPGASFVESREFARLALHPTGERPRVVNQAVVGASIRGGETAAAVADEVLFGDSLVGDNTDGGPAVQGGQFLLAGPLPRGGTAFQVAPQALRVAAGLYNDTIEFLDQLPSDAGLMRIGSEIVCYQALDAASGVVTLAPGGRGLLGTQEEEHELGQTATFLDGWPVGLLAGGASAGSSSLALVDTQAFPPGGGTVRIDDELLHYAQLAGGALEMPGLSSQPGAMDGKGQGLFRGRFGTTPSAHAAGTPVILHPFRYWDRWTDEADAPELGYFGFAVEQENAFWRNTFFDAEEPASGGARVGVLQRVTQRSDRAVPWDAPPGESPLLRLLEPGVRSDANPIGLQADLVEWRAFVQFQQGAFDPVTAGSHGWKQTPRLRILGVSYLGPDLVLRRVDR